MDQLEIAVKEWLDHTDIYSMKKFFIERNINLTPEQTKNIYLLIQKRQVEGVFYLWHDFTKDLQAVFSCKKSTEEGNLL